MKSPQVSTLIVALIFSVIAYFLADNIAVTSVTVAIITFIAAFLAPLFAGAAGSVSTGDTDEDDEVKTLYVGNLPYRANESALRELFSTYGTVHSVRLMKDKHTGKRRGFGFVEISASAADTAISSLNDTEFQQRTLKVREAKERPEKSNNED